MLPSLGCLAATRNGTEHKCQSNQIIPKRRAEHVGQSTGFQYQTSNLGIQRMTAVASVVSAIAADATPHQSELFQVLQSCREVDNAKPDLRSASVSSFSSMIS